jgi:hypothetical protein
MGKVAVTEISRASYSVVIERVIEIGSKLNISPSYGYAGVEDGTVVVIDIVTAEEYISSPHRFSEIGEYLGAAYSSDTINLDDTTPYVPTEYKDTVWVYYSYTGNNSGNYRYVFPIDEFASYTSDVS